MNNFSVDLIEVEGENKLNVPAEELEAARLDYMAAKAKVEQGQELNLEEQRQVILYYRLNREYKFILNKKTAKKPRERKAKKLSRVKLVELIEKSKETELSEDEQKDMEYSLEVYKGRKLSKLNLNKLMFKNTEGGLSELELKDVCRTIFGEVTESNLKLTIEAIGSEK